MDFDIARQIMIDHHAHVMRDDFRTVDTIGLRQPFTESRSLAVVEKHVPFSVTYLDFLARIGELLDLSGESQLLEVREQMTGREYVNVLFDDAGIGAFIVDDGFSPANAMPIAKFSDLCERPVYRCRRIEQAIEQALASSNNFAEMESIFPSILIEESEYKIVALKTIAAYRGGLNISIVSKTEAQAFFDTAKRTSIRNAKARIDRNPLYHYFLGEAFALAEVEGLPVQVHCGFGDQDQDLQLANPAHMRSILESKRYSKTQFVFLHCFPFVAEAAHLAALYANVHMDISLIGFIASPMVTKALYEALSCAPFSKILVSTDGHSLPETYWYGAYAIRRGLSTALHHLFEEGFIRSMAANKIAAHLLHQNARHLYQLEGLK